MVAQASKPKSSTTTTSKKSKKLIPVQDPLSATSTAPLIEDISNKKRGRKPKGGKIIEKMDNSSSGEQEKPNIILHLKCHLRDLTEMNSQCQKILKDNYNYDPSIPPDIVAYNATSDQNHYFVIDSDHQQKSTGTNIDPSPVLAACCDQENKNNTNSTTTTEIHEKLKKLKIQLFKNTISEKNCACFWCSYEYDNPTCYIPKYELDGTIHGYGAFCMPECAVAYLMNESIDDSIKFERYYLLNNLYGKIYEYKNSIKPAPRPHYFLNKFYGNMTIQEFRQLMRSEKTFIMVEKPLTRVLPELHEERDELITHGSSSSVGNTGIYKVKRQSEKQQKQSKSAIIKEAFGIS
jgi:hypothetical protein